MNIQNSASILKNKWPLCFFTILLLLLVLILIFENELNANNNPLKGVLIDADPGADVYFVDEYGNMRNLTNHPKGDRNASWSPDGERIAFLSNRHGNWGLYIMDADGSNQRPLYCPEKPLIVHGLPNPVWRPDGKKVAVYTDRNPHSLSSHFYKIIDVNPEPITKTEIEQFDIETDLIEFQKKLPGNGIGKLAWSPDGKKIAFVGMAVLFVMDNDGKNKKELVRSDNFEFGPDTPTWSPDSKKIVFTSRMRNSSKKIDISDICIVDIGNSKITNLTKDRNLSLTKHILPTWSPDSKKIAFVSTKFDYVVGGGGIYVVNIETLEIKKITEHVMDTAPSWSPDGDKIAFLSNREIDPARREREVLPFALRLYFMDTNGNNVKRLTNFEDPQDDVSIHQIPRWSPVK